MDGPGRRRLIPKNRPRSAAVPAAVAKASCIRRRGRDAPETAGKVPALQLQSSSMIVIVMGVVGAGKTTIGRLLAEQLAWEFEDADDFHPASNVEKIRRGVAVDDDDRRPWLERLRAAITQWIAEHRNVVLACSALKRSYRQELEA